jgi:hypothetical protein
MKNSRTASGNALLARLACSVTRESKFSVSALENLYDAYELDQSKIEKCIRELIRSCDIPSLSVATIKLAEIATEYFNKKKVAETR